MNHRKYDVIVAGFGTAGSIAAIAAARAGASVLALERTHYAGGTHTGGFVTFHYLQKPHGLMAEIDRRNAEELTFAGVAETRKHGLELMARELGVEIVYEAAVVGVLRDGDKVTGVRYAKNRTVETVYAHTVIDATGDAAVCRLAGAELRGGRAFDGVFMPFTNSMAKEHPVKKWISDANFDAGRIDQYRECEFSRTMLATARVHLHADFSEFRDRLIPSDLPGVREGRNIVPEGRTMTLADVLDGEARVDEPVGSVQSQDLRGLYPVLFTQKILAPVGLQERSAVLDYIRHRFSFEHRRIVVDYPLVSAEISPHLDTERKRVSYDRADAGVHSGGISPARNNCDLHMATTPDVHTIIPSKVYHGLPSISSKNCICRRYFAESG